MALIAYYADRQEELICRACRSSETALEGQGLVHFAGSDRVFTQTRVSISCRNCGESNAFLFGGDQVQVREESARGEGDQLLSRWLPNLSPLLTWILG